MDNQPAHAFDVVCMGETMVQLVPDGTPGFADTDRAILHQAGAESNVAVGLSRLGANAAWISRLGDDAFGTRIRNALAAENVDCSAVLTDPEAQTGLFVKEVRGDTRKVHYYRKHSAASRMSPEDASRALQMRARVLLTSGVTAALSTSCEKALRCLMAGAQRTDSLIAFDVNYRPVLWPSAEEASLVLHELAESSDMVFIGLDEAAALWDCADPDDVRRHVPSPRTLVVKNGPGPATVFSAGETLEVPALPVEVVDAVGAGDAFAAGFIFGHLRGWGDLLSARAGHVLAGAALESISDQGEPLSAIELERRIQDPLLWGPTTKNSGANHDER